MKMLPILLLITLYNFLPSQEIPGFYFVDSLHGIKIKNTKNYIFKFDKNTDNWLRIIREGNLYIRGDFEKSISPQPLKKKNDYFQYVAKNPGRPMIAADGMDGSMVSEPDSIIEFFSIEGIRIFERYEKINEILYVKVGDEWHTTYGKDNGKIIGPIYWLDLSRKDYPYFLKLYLSHYIRFATSNEREDMLEIINSIKFININ